LAAVEDFPEEITFEGRRWRRVRLFYEKRPGEWHLPGPVVGAEYRPGELDHQV